MAFPTRSTPKIVNILRSASESASTYSRGTRHVVEIDRAMALSRHVRLLRSLREARRVRRNDDAPDVPASRPEARPNTECVISGVYVPQIFCPLSTTSSPS